ncbi:Non-specific serine/threonine protein kinase [Cinnamomum micranthum f. kanehirae]|uniref:Non-specific serine/threonine protein kinase n=1 Tax=Cinnamomum micranthum f. kanehirae TaxID=337451 RepID=A0A443Q3G7_9MAGN|nr:Non-specific serine/threonine protein kinase [Cinnamomum micranthum f. kanehirae]
MLLVWDNCNVGGKVKEINLFNASLKSNLENLSISSFQDLTILYLSSNASRGTVPTHIGSLTKLIILDLSMNKFFGAASFTWKPDKVNYNLTTLYIHRNNISGSIPQVIGNSNNLIDLGMSYKLLSSSIPSTLGNLTKLVTFLRNLINLKVSSNLLTSSIPPTIGNLTKLTNLYIHRNNISGSIPQEMGNLNKLILLGDVI